MFMAKSHCFEPSTAYPTYQPTGLLMPMAQPVLAQIRQDPRPWVSMTSFNREVVRSDSPRSPVTRLRKKPICSSALIFNESSSQNLSTSLPGLLLP